MGLLLAALLSKETGIVGLPLIFLFNLLIKKDRHKSFLWLIYGGATFLFYLFWRLLVAKIPLRQILAESQARQAKSPY